MGAPRKSSYFGDFYLSRHAVLCPVSRFARGSVAGGSWRSNPLCEIGCEADILLGFESSQSLALGRRDVEAGDE